MVKATVLSERLGLLGKGPVKRILKTLESYGLPTAIPDLDPDEVLSVMKKDKKRKHGKLKIVLLDSIGKAVVREVGDKEIKGVI